MSDTASDDDTAEVVRSFGDERIDCVHSERNVGAVGNLNRLIGLADTKFLLLLPDDDILYPGHLGAAVELLERFETAGRAHSAFDVIDARSEVVRRVDPVRSRSPVTIERQDLVLERMMLSAWPIGFSSVVYRTRAIVEAGGFRAEEEPPGDLQLWMRIALDWDFGYIAESLAGFRVHAESHTTGIGADEGVTAAGRELDLLLTPIRFQRRINFLDDAALEPRSKEWFRALATLAVVNERAAAGLAWREVVARLANIVRTSLRIVLRSELWVLVLRPQAWRRSLGRLGGRRVRSALRRAPARRRRLRQP